MRVPLWSAPLTADEGGYAEAARLWERSDTLYRDVWVDRPQGLVLVFRAILHVGGSPDTLRAAAAIVAALAVVATMAVAFRIGGRITGYAAGVLMATAGSSPFVESFTLAGELIASLPAILSLFAFTLYLRGRRIEWLVAAGLATGFAVMVKQSGFDAGLAEFAFLAWTERRRALRPAVVLVAAAAVPVLAGAFSAVDLHRWWFAVAGYRGEGDSIVTGSFLHRLDLLAQSLPGAAKGLGLLVILAAVGWRASPLLVRLWLGAALLGVIGGGNFHSHYYIQLVPPLSVLAGVGVEALIRNRSRVVAALCGAAAVATTVVTVQVWFESGAAQARDVWPKDGHLVTDPAVARYVAAHSRPDQKVLVIWAAANVYYLADRAPATPYMWQRNVESIPEALDDVRDAIAERRAALVALIQPVRAVDRTGVTQGLLACNYRPAAVIDGVRIYAPRRGSGCRYVRR